MSKVTRTFTHEGKRYYIYGSTEEEVKKKIVQKKKELKAEPKTDQSITLNQWADICVKDYKHFKTVEYEKTFIYRLNSCVLKYLGNMKLTEIKPIDCQRCLNEQNGKSKYQIDQTLQMMNFLFEIALDNDLIAKNPARRLKKPNGNKSQRRSMTYEEKDKLLQVVDKDDYKIFALMYYLGLRPEEARNLKWNNIICKETYNVATIEASKTANGVREIPMPIELSKLLVNTLKSEYVAPRSDGRKHTDSSFYEAWKRLKSELEIDDETFVPYVLRHTYATNLQNNGIPVSMAQKLLGHSKAELTMEIYQHNDDNAIYEIAQRMKCCTPSK